MIIIADQILLYRKIHVLLLLLCFCDVIFKFCIKHPKKIFWSRHCMQQIIRLISSLTFIKIKNLEKKKMNQIGDFSH